ncbi:MAG: hypothetical protein WC583_00365 [Candidatus Omnitrophota bacterium]|jgi:ureidoglycolate hydrolase|nr:hypothetical protein [Candidatus Omnitrophota bacterium]MDD5526765.1 hypothetical protein [Candidatus Omnitrophota bacterium]
MPKKITPASFRKYGKLIHYPDIQTKDKHKNLFRIVLSESRGHGWRIAYLVVRDRVIGDLERHPGTFETFEPVKGRVLLYVARDRDARKIDCFLLDRPIVLFKGVWHGVVSLDREAEIKITENAVVSCEYWSTGLRLNGTLGRES